MATSSSGRMRADAVDEPFGLFVGDLDEGFAEERAKAPS